MMCSGGAMLAERKIYLHTETQNHRPADCHVWNQIVHL